jgi:putative SOS response-associated peptidase YedK
MCGRFTLTHREARRLAADLGVSVDSFIDYRPRYNIAPTDAHWIVRMRYEDREVLAAKWGLINFWVTDRKQAFKEHQRSCGDGAEPSFVSRGVYAAALCCACGRFLRVDRSEGRPQADLVPS